MDLQPSTVREVDMPYYHIAFKFEGKKECEASCSTFWVDDNLNQTEAFDQCLLEAHSKLKEFFRDILPDDAVDLLPHPEVTGITLIGDRH